MHVSERNNIFPPVCLCVLLMLAVLCREGTKDKSISFLPRGVSVVSPGPCGETAGVQRLLAVTMELNK